MTEIRVGVVDVYLIHPQLDAWQVLVLRRAEGTRCTGAWEVVHGRIDAGESPEDAAVREVREETGLEIERLYTVTCQLFYLPRLATVQVAVVFAAFVPRATSPTLGPEHDLAEWLSVDEALARFTWPRSRHALHDIEDLLGGGDAGPAEDVLRAR
jgi:8-oxo-dGTP pyrophosphatase MutT (NUDIX family)